MRISAGVSNIGPWNHTYTPSRSSCPSRAAAAWALAPQLGRVNVGHVGEPRPETLVVGAGQHADPGQVHMVGDHGKVASGHAVAAAPGRVGEHHHPASGRDRGPNREGDRLRVVALVGVGPTRQHQHPVAAHLRRVGRARVPDGGRDREPRQVPVRHGHLVADPVGIAAQPRTPAPPPHRAARTPSARPAPQPPPAAAHTDRSCASPPDHRPRRRAWVSVSVTSLVFIGAKQPARTLVSTTSLAFIGAKQPARTSASTTASAFIGLGGGPRV